MQLLFSSWQCRGLNRRAAETVGSCVYPSACVSMHPDSLQPTTDKQAMHSLTFPTASLLSTRSKLCFGLPWHSCASSPTRRKAETRS